jgi:hypothetical protein
VQQQHRQQRPRLAPAERDRTALLEDLKRAKDAGRADGDPSRWTTHARVGIAHYLRGRTSPDGQSTTRGAPASTR